MITFFICILLTLFSFFLKESKILSTLLFMIMWGLFGWNFWNADFLMYVGMYNIPVSKLDFFGYEGGYNFLIFCCKSIGLNFQQFHILIATIVLFLVFRFFNTFSKLPAFSTACFFWVFFPLQFVILRNFIAFSIVLQGLISVLKNEKYSKEKYIFFVLLASTIHISSLFYFVFVFAFRKSEIKIKTISFWIVGLVILTILSYNFVFSIISLVNLRKALFYRTSLTLFLAYSVIQILNLFVVKYFLNYNSDSNSNGDVLNSRRNNIILNINILMLFLIPIYYELAVFIRILLNMSIVNIVFITNKSFLIESKRFPKFLFVIYLSFWFFSFIFLVRQNTIISLFNNNLLLEAIFLNQN